MAINIPSLTIDPVSGLVDYTLELKPYHTKVLEVSVEYIHTDCIYASFEEAFYLAFGQPYHGQLDLWGWTDSQAHRYFNGNFNFYQIMNVNIPQRIFTIRGNQTSVFSIDDKIIVETDNNIIEEYTIVNISTSTQSGKNHHLKRTSCSNAYETYSLDPATFCSKSTISYTVTNITVNKALVAYDSQAKGLIHHSSHWSYDSERLTYQYEGGIVWPSRSYVQQHQNCYGYGIQFQNSFDWQSDDPYVQNELVQYGKKVYRASSNVSAGTIPPAAPWVLLGDSIQRNNTVVEIVGANVFVINNVNIPYEYGGWNNVFLYGVKFKWNKNLREYTVLSSTLDESTNKLYIYTLELIEDIDDNTLLPIVGSPLGIINVRPFGYDEPSVCKEQGQSLALYAHITESFVIDLGIDDRMFISYDVDQWDVEGFDFFDQFI